MSTDLVPVEALRVELGVLRADRPKQLVEVATEAANALASVIESRKLYSNIQGKKFVKCEGWTTLAAMLGVTPHEISVTEVEGAFTATVELRRLTDGQPVSRASAECGPDETTWKSRPRYARRSMALTRATAKACRLAFSWIMALSGYEVTPAEEIPHEDGGGKSPAPESKRRAAAAPVQSAPTAPVREPETGPLSEKPRALEDANPDPATWPFGSERGRLLSSYDSEALVAKRNWLLKKARKPEEFAELVQQIDDELASRGGE
jgi:hypothetical protein